MKAHLDDLLVGGEHSQEGGHDEDGAHGDYKAMNGGEDQPMYGCPSRLFLVCRAQIEGSGGVDAHAEADGSGIYQVLHRVDEGQGCHGLLADPCHEEAVHDVVEGIDQHGEHHGQGHAGNQRENRFFFHKGVVHFQS